MYFLLVQSYLCLALLLYFVDLIKSHKQTTPHVNGSRSHVSSINNNISNKSKSSFSWQRPKQPDGEKKQPTTGHSGNHSYKLDRRKMTTSSSGMSSIRGTLSGHNRDLLSHIQCIPICTAWNWKKGTECTFGRTKL